MLSGMCEVAVMAIFDAGVPEQQSKQCESPFVQDKALVEVKL